MLGMVDPKAKMNQLIFIEKQDEEKKEDKDE
jgi:methyl-coenzyme M reductase subunit D